MVSKPGVARKYKVRGTRLWALIIQIKRIGRDRTGDVWRKCRRTSGLDLERTAWLNLRCSRRAAGTWITASPHFENLLFNVPSRLLHVFRLAQIPPIVLARRETQDVFTLSRKPQIRVDD